LRDYRIGHFHKAGDVGALCDTEAAIFNQCAGIITVEFVLSGAGQCDIARNIPRALTFKVR